MDEFEEQEYAIPDAPEVEDVEEEVNLAIFGNLFPPTHPGLTSSF